MELSLFEEVADAVHGLAPRELGPVRCRPRRYGIKVWFGPDQPPREHYEAQVIAAEHDAGARVLVLEVGFHSEYPGAADNDAVLASLLAREDEWRREIGASAVAGPFLGRPGDWRRVSETWPDPDLEDGELAFEVAARLTDYITALEPVRRSGAA